jgi:uncharacterized SAM-binding protein YcdF (DUF218 family)
VFYWLSKIVTPFLSVYGFVFIGLGLVVFFIRKGKTRLAYYGALATLGLVWLFSLMPVAHWMYASLENRYVPTPVEQLPQADAIVVLGGAIVGAYAPRVYPELTSSADRILHAFRLFQAHKAEWIVTTGASSEGVSEAQLMKELLVEWGVPKENILTEQHSVNTYQNAANVKTIAQQREFGKILLVTSAAHMQRAQMTFQAQGLDVIPAPTDYEAPSASGFSILNMLPNPEAALFIALAVKEYLGLVVYKLRGWA